MSEGSGVQVIMSSAKNAVINKFAVLHPALWISQILITSFFSMFFFWLLADYINNPEVTTTFVIIGNAVQSVAMTTLYSVAEIPGTEKHVGTLGILMQSPASLFNIFLGMSFFGILSGMIAMSVSLCFASFVFGVSFASCNFFSIIVMLILTCVSLSGLGMLIGSIGIHLRTSAIIANVMTYIGLLICGVNFPVSYLPEWVQVISDCLPLTYAIEATREAINGAGITAIWMDLAMMIVLGAIFFVIAGLSFTFFEKKARIKGTADSF